MRIKWVSFYTPRYKRSAGRLMDSLDKQGLDFDVAALPDEFSEEPGEKFLAAVRFKPQFILNSFQKYSNYDAIVWTDADSEILRPPKLLYEIDCDVACRYRDGFELLSGTMLWRVCYKVHQFLPEWARMMGMEEVRKLACPEQQVLQEVLPKTPLEVYRLPEEYVYVAPHPDLEPDALRDKNNAARKVEPIIYHHQQSRSTRDA